jgi:hypothetical protein
MTTLSVDTPTGKLTAPIGMATTMTSITQMATTATGKNSEITATTAPWD